MMNELQSLDSIFNRKIFRIPDYQRGYSWQIKQLKDFWEDLINLSDDRSHYTGVLTLKEFDPKEINETDKEYWLVEDHDYKMYHIVDGQQRLTTFVVFIQAFIDVIKQLEENKNKSDQEIYITNTLNLNEVIKRYLYETKPNNMEYRTYKFGYSADNPSYAYLKHKIFNEENPPSIEDTFYTLNLKNAKNYFYEKLRVLHSNGDISVLEKIYKKLAKRFLFNEYVIKDEVNVFIAFETMNNRGKSLSDLELLKNRLIYLTTLYTNKELEADDRKELRDSINKSWKRVYHQLGRNDKHPLNDDDFLKAHWIMCFQYSRSKEKVHINFLLNEHFSSKRIYKNIEREVTLTLPEERRADSEEEDREYDNGITEDDYIDFVNFHTGKGTSGPSYLKYMRKLETQIDEPIFNTYTLAKLNVLKERLLKGGDLYDFNRQMGNNGPSSAIGKLIDFYEGEPTENQPTESKPTRNTDVGQVAFLKPSEIREYVNSLESSSVHWFNSFYPYLATDLSEDEKEALDRLNRIGIGYFRPLIMSVLKNEKSSEKRIDFFDYIERFIFIIFRLGQARSNYGDSESYRLARKFNQSKLPLEEIKKSLDEILSEYLNDDGTFNSTDFYNYLYKRFDSGAKSGYGYYGWDGLRYFLYEYENELLCKSRQRKVSWEDSFKKTGVSKDKVSIEHVFPQTPTDSWKKVFADVGEENYLRYSGSLGNLLLLSSSINSSLQNDDFSDKKNKKDSAGKTVRNGYFNGSHSEIEVAQEEEWTPIQIEERGLRLLTFMEERWGIKFKDEATKKSLLFLENEKDANS